MEIEILQTKASKNPRKSTIINRKDTKAKQKDEIHKKQKNSDTQYIIKQKKKKKEAQNLDDNEPNNMNKDNDEQKVDYDEVDEEIKEQAAEVLQNEDDEEKGESDEVANENKENIDNDMVEEIGELANVQEKKKKTSKKQEKKKSKSRKKRGQSQKEKKPKQDNKKKKKIKKKAKKRWLDTLKKPKSLTGAERLMGMYERERIQRSKTQRIYLLSAKRITDKEWNFTVMGTTGNNYQLLVSKGYLQCGCLDFRLRHRTCKHLYFIISQVAQNESLIKKVNHNPIMDDEVYDELDQQLLKRLKSRLEPKKLSEDHIKEEKEQIDFGEDNFCPICFEDLHSENVTQCKTCKKYLHQNCIDLWITKNQNCPLCRSLWQKKDEDLQELNGNESGALSKLKNQFIELNEIQEDNVNI